MECRVFEVTLVSAQNLENVRRFFTNRVMSYAKISLGDNPKTEKKTPEDKEGQTNPVWNFKAKYTIGKNEVESQGINLLIRLYCIRTMEDTLIGEVSVSLKELYDRFSTLPEGEDAVRMSYPVKRGGADSHGEVNLSYKFGLPSRDWGKLFSMGTKFLTKSVFGGELFHSADLLNYWRDKLRLIIILFLFFFTLQILFFFLLIYLLLTK